MFSTVPRKSNLISRMGCQFWATFWQSYEINIYNSIEKKNKHGIKIPRSTILLCYVGFILFNCFSPFCKSHEKQLYEVAHFCYFSIFLDHNKAKCVSVFYQVAIGSLKMVFRVAGLALTSAQGSENGSVSLSDYQSWIKQSNVIHTVVLSVWYWLHFLTAKYMNTVHGKLVVYNILLLCSVVSSDEPYQYHVSLARFETAYNSLVHP
jgi:hypothetical protein